MEMGSTATMTVIEGSSLCFRDLVILQDLLEVLVRISLRHDALKGNVEESILSEGIGYSQDHCRLAWHVGMLLQHCS